jgi:hypothetical protein
MDSSLISTSTRSLMKRLINLTGMRQYTSVQLTTHVGSHHSPNSTPTLRATELAPRDASTTRNASYHAQTSSVTCVLIVSALTAMSTRIAKLGRTVARQPPTKLVQNSVSAQHQPSENRQRTAKTILQSSAYPVMTGVPTVLKKE